MQFNFRRLTAAMAAVATFVAVPAALAANELPTRKAGLWELTTAMDEGAGPREQTFKMCVGEAMERQTVEASMTEHKANCSRYEIQRTGDATTVDADCVYSQANVSSRTEMSGDFKTTFAVKIASTTARQVKDNQTVSVKRNITQNGRYLGDACGDLQPGEAMGADGAKLLVQ